jgi:hypothetical protein
LLLLVVPHGNGEEVAPLQRQASPHGQCTGNVRARRHVRSSGCGSGWSGHPGRWPRPCPRLPLTSLLTASHAVTGDVQLALSCRWAFVLGWHVPGPVASTCSCSSRNVPPLRRPRSSQ